MLLGLGILIASVSFLCYRNSTWSFLSWLQRQPLEGGAKSKQEHADASTGLDAPTIITEHVVATDEEQKDIMSEIKAEIDRKAIPPPLPPFAKPSASSAPSAIPTFTLAQEDSHSSEKEEEEYTPSFPALNSAQRASTTSTTQRFPPRLPPASASRSNGLMAPPPRPSPLPNRNPTAASNSGLAPPPSHSSVPTKPSRKVLLAPGHSPLDWARLTSSPHANLRGLPPSTPYLRVPPSLLKTMNGRSKDKSTGLKRDAWTVLGGKVYNITPYIPYHPGGEGELIRCAGKDGTRLFAEVHPWVNWEGMLEGCLVGVAVEEKETAGGALEEMD